MGLHTPDQIKSHPIYEALNPHGKHFIETRLLHRTLNPYADEGIDVVAYVLIGMPHSKVIPAHVMMWRDYVNGVYEGKHTLVVPSSGNTVDGVGRLARAYGLRVKAIMSSDVPSSKLDILRASGTVEVLPVSNVVERALEEAAKPGHHHLDQYGHEGNPESHERYTGPEIARAGGRERPRLIAVALGSGGTALGLAKYFLPTSTKIIGVRPKLGEQVPGARDEKKMAEVVKFPWQALVPDVISVSRKDSFIGARQLWSAVEPRPGPTSGMAWKGLMAYLERLGSDGRSDFRGGYVGFFCPDDGRFYSTLMLAELDPDQGVM